MTDYIYDVTAVYDQLGGAVRVARNARITVTNPTTGATSVGLKQSGQPVSWVTTDSKGRARFTATLGSVIITAPNGLTRLLVSPGYQAELATAASQSTLARNPDAIITGTVTRDANGAATSAPVTWPDGTSGTYTALVVSATFPGAVDSYRITYGSPAARTYTQPTITRGASGAATTVPAITVT